MTSENKIEILIFRRHVFLSFFSAMLHCCAREELVLIWYVSYFLTFLNQLLVAKNFLLLCYIVLTAIEIRIGNLGVNEVCWWRTHSGKQYFTLKKNVSTTLLLTNTDFPHELFENSLKNRQLNILHWSSHFGHVASWWGPVWLWTTSLLLILISIDFSFGYSTLPTSPVGELV